MRWFYRVVQLEHGLCFHAERYQLEAPNGRKYNALQFAGTVDLAHDLNLLRQAVGAPKMSLYGASYGTAVASVYSKIYPDQTLRVVMDGVLDPTPEVLVRADASAKGIESVWQGVISDCEGSLVRGLAEEKRCPAAPQASSKFMQILSGPDRASAGLLTTLITLTTLRAMNLAPFVMACVQQLSSGVNVTGCSQALEAMNVLLQKTTKSQPQGDVPRDRFGLAIQAVVMGTDTAGRLNEEEFINWWRRAKVGRIFAHDLLSLKAWMTRMPGEIPHRRPLGRKLGCDDQHMAELCAAGATRRGCSPARRGHRQSAARDEASKERSKLGSSIW